MSLKLLTQLSCQISIHDLNLQFLGSFCSNFPFFFNVHQNLYASRAGTKGSAGTIHFPNKLSWYAPLSVSVFCDHDSIYDWCSKHYYSHILKTGTVWRGEKRSTEVQNLGTTQHKGSEFGHSTISKLVGFWPILAKKREWREKIYQNEAQIRLFSVIQLISFLSYHLSSPKSRLFEDQTCSVWYPHKRHPGCSEVWEPK
jgi:hypothetical protein